MGIVYRATYLKTGQDVAVKVLAPDLTADPKLARRFQREMDILKKLRHPHIVRYYGGSSSGAQRFYAMEMITGGSLDDLLRKRNTLSWEEAVEYGIHIAKALEHAHNEGVIHRDLKPGNLLLTKKGRIKLSDFGIARDTQATALTQAGKTVGTMAYMAPEQITGKKPVSRRTDLYALGCVMFQMLTGRTPFESETHPEMLFKHIQDDPPSVREYNMDVPIWLDRLIDDMLAKEPEDRPFDALAVQVQLEEVRTKVAEQESIIRETAAGGQSALTLKEGDRQLATKLVGKKKKKRKKKQLEVPVYERTWFLGSALAGVLLLVVWSLWPESEAAIFDRIQQVMASDDPGDWGAAESDIKDYLERFPEAQQASQVSGWHDQIEMYRAERRAETNIRFGRDPQTEAEQLFVEAKQYEKFGDRLTALSKYEAMVTLLKEQRDDSEARPFINLARRQAQRIKSSVGSSTDRTAFIKEQLAEADTLYLAGEAVRAREKWQSIVRLYGDNAEFEVHVQKARARLIDPKASMQAEEVSGLLDEAVDTLDRATREATDL
ncbi:Serine/threonine-protein kinase PK-1 [Maioricimonas rarisocia]|uniref:non-specific serine/threonine protein kinase n=2 Tax=Maioricimonas rarisocia TaxID=2528026 RepID=A0A517Z0G4_9PLAN|nr:Serine/threonine-protein kinase PK-1 [Maioricimonas rarisocia]